LRALLSILRDKGKRAEIEKKMKLSNVNDFGENQMGEYLAPFRPTHDYERGAEIVIKLAAVTARDTVYELGSGDARMLAEIARRSGCQGVGVELNQNLVDESNKMLAVSGLTGRVRVERGDFCGCTIKAAATTVVYLYVTAEGMEILAPKLVPVLKAGGRVVSYTFAVQSKAMGRGLGGKGAHMRPVVVRRLEGVPAPYGKYYLYDRSSVQHL
jgi:SAM-dependent methyltransferase